jgi:tetratricopeptide (TPR) repeat protein
MYSGGQVHPAGQVWHPKEKIWPEFDGEFCMPPGLKRKRFAKLCRNAVFLAFRASLLCAPIHIVSEAVAANSHPALAQDDAAKLRSAKESFEAGDYTSASKMLEAALEKNNGVAEIHFWIGRCSYELFDFNMAAADFEQAIQLDLKNSVYHLWLGRADSERADREHSLSLARKVKKEFQAAVQLDPSNIAARRDLAEYEVDAPWIAGGDKDDARKQVEAIAALDAIDGQLARAMYVFHAEKKPAQAEEIYKKLLEQKPPSIQSYFEMARFFQHHGLAADFELAIQGAAAIDATDPRLDYFRGVLQFAQQSDLPGAERRLDNYVNHTPPRSNWPSHADAREWLGRILEAEGKRAEAMAQYREALRLDSKRKIARERLKELEKSGD